uniref:C2H2-type domain-containing protein n=1 Tax=Tolypocladium ophioglossoides (strain CBS 100239) TaxID=1163406 RepID=A0A0L0N068_TOLOC
MVPVTPDRRRHLGRGLMSGPAARCHKAGPCPTRRDRYNPATLPPIHWPFSRVSFGCVSFGCVSFGRVSFDRVSVTVSKKLESLAVVNFETVRLAEPPYEEAHVQGTSRYYLDSVMSSASSPVSIMTPESDTGSFTPTSPALGAQDYMYRSMVRQLLSRYTRQELDQILDQEGHEAASYGPGSLAATHSGGSIALAPDDVAHGMVCYTSRFGALDDTSPRTPQRPVLHPSAASGPPRPLVRVVSPGSPTHGTGGGTRAGGRSSSCKMDYACGFCAEIAIPKTCTRRNDLRRHIDQFHNTNAQWLCQHPGCHMAFDWPTAYQIHLREDHGGSLMKVTEAKVVLCPQTVFACGYEGCPRVFEAANDADTTATWKLYTAHLIKHCEEGHGTGPWEYSHRMRNLLSQSRLSAAWKASSESSDSTQLQWDPASSRTLRKLLETRHIDNLQQLVNCAVMLGSATENPGRVEAKFNLHLPIKRECPAAAVKHEMSGHSPLTDMVLNVSPYSMPRENSAAYHDIPEDPHFSLAVIPTRSSGPINSYTGYNNCQTLPTPVASPHHLYGLPGQALYQLPEEAAQQEHYATTNDVVAVPRGHADPWTALYTYAELNMGDPMAL